MKSVSIKYQKKIAIVTIIAFAFVLLHTTLHTHDALFFSSKGHEINAHDCADHKSHPSINSHGDCIQCQRVKIKEFDCSIIQSTKIFLQESFYPINSDDQPFRFVIHTHPDKRGPPLSIS